MVSQSNYDAVIIGGGPAGSTIATLLAKSNLNVVVLERETFPRFHIGESLLAASVPIFERLGVHDVIRERFIRKGGGKWLYGSDPVRGDFSNHDHKASFKDTPYAYMVERAQFDKLLLDHAESCGAEVRYRNQVTDIIHENDRVVGVRTRGEDGQEADVRANLVFDCSGLPAVIANHLKLRRPNSLKRCAVYAHYKARPVDDDLKDGWFVGQMIYDGWTWLIPLEQELISVGVVLSIDRYREVQQSPDDFLDAMVHANELLRTGMTPDAERVSEVRVNGNVGYTSDHLVGDGWVLVGDAAFFIDPCYSSGVHMAMHSGEMAADTFLAGHAHGDYSAKQFAQYEKKLKQHEKTVTRMVDSFYMASRNRAVQRATVLAHRYGKRGTRKFVTFVGGDFAKNTAFISNVNRMSRAINFVFGKGAGIREAGVSRAVGSHHEGTACPAG